MYTDCDINLELTGSNFLSPLYCGIHMMSLLILNQNVLYLVLFITLWYGLTSANQNITIYVQEDGIDQSECMEGKIYSMSYIVLYLESDEVMTPLLEQTFQCM